MEKCWRYYLKNDRAFPIYGRPGGPGGRLYLGLVADISHLVTRKAVVPTIAVLISMLNLELRSMEENMSGDILGSLGYQSLLIGRSLSLWLTCD